MRTSREKRREIRRASDVYVCDFLVVDGYWAEARVFETLPVSLSEPPESQKSHL